MTGSRRREHRPPTAHSAAARLHPKAWAGGAVLLLVLLLAAVLAWRETSDVDFGFHLAAGRYILERGAWPAADPFSYTLPEARYVDMNGLFQVTLATAHRLGGDVGVGLLVVALVLASVVILWMHARRRRVTSPTAFALVLCACVLAWEIRFSPRPELATWLLLALQLLLLQRHYEDRRARWLAPLPILQLVWVYAHTLSLLGLAVTGLYALANLPTGRRRDAGPWIALAASGAVMFLNPYGLEGLQFLWMLRTRLSAGNVFAETINELRSPFDAAVSNIWPVVWFKALLVGGAALTLARIHKRRLFDLFVLALFGWLAASALRNVALFAIAAAPPLLEAAQELRDAAARRWARRPVPARLFRAAPVGAAAVLLFVSSQALLGGYYISDMRPERFGAGLSPVVTPGSNVDFIERSGFEGPIFNELRFGGYLLGRLWPRERVFVDGRLEVYGEEFHERYLAIVGGSGWDGMVRRHDPGLVLAATTSRNLVARLAGDPGWSAVSVDGASVLFARRDEHRRESVDAAHAALFAQDDGLEADAAPLAPRRKSFLASLVEIRRYPWTARGRGNGFMLLGLAGAARREYRKALVEAGWDEAGLAFNYASANLRLGRRDEARTWFERVLELDPSNAPAKQRLAELR